MMSEVSEVHRSMFSVSQLLFQDNTVIFSTDDAFVSRRSGISHNSP